MMKLNIPQMKTQNIKNKEINKFSNHCRMIIQDFGYSKFHIKLTQKNRR
jgi:hypothetical protein